MIAVALRPSRCVLLFAFVWMAAGCERAEAGRATQGLHDCDQASDPCDDGDPCTADSCDVAAGVCMHAPIAGCCQQDADCNDDRSCTTDRCDDGVCVFESIVGCVPPDGGGQADAALDVDGGGDPPPADAGGEAAGLEVQGGACALGGRDAGGAGAALLLASLLALLVRRK